MDNCSILVKVHLSALFFPALQVYVCQLLLGLGVGSKFSFFFRYTISIRPKLANVAGMCKSYIADTAAELC